MAALLSFLIIIILVIKCSSSCENYGEYINRVNDYEVLINSKIKESYYYDLPNSADQYKPNTQKIYDYGWVDFIIIGAGPTGSVIANRLSNIKEWKVLVLEAGEASYGFGEIPGMSSYLVNSQFNWNYKSVQQKYSCLGMEDQRCPVTRGKTLGGTTGIDSLVYARGNRRDFNRWATQGNRGWSFEEILLYYVKSENCQIDADGDDDEIYHGKGGYLNVKGRRSASPQFSAFVKAHKELLNCSLNNDYNGKYQLGISPLQFNIIRNNRQSVGTAFLTPIEFYRKNLEILQKAFVTKVLVNPQYKTAYGVEFIYNGKRYYVGSTMEVILSAGAISSPKILMLSGIGAKEELIKHNISLIQDLPVGKALVEPPTFYGLFVQTNYSAPQKSVYQNVEDYVINTGLYEVPGNAEAISYYKSSYNNFDGYPDVAVKLMTSPCITPVNQRVLRLTDETFNALWSKIDPQSALNLQLTLLQPKSVGSLKLASKDPFEYPLIDLNIFSNPQDIEIMYESLQLVEKLLDTPAMKAINATIVQADYPQCKMYLTGSKDYWTCVFKLLTASSYASVSTCRMGKTSSEFVVNDKLQVYGVRNLRIADLSIFPDPVSAYPTATAVMIGEKVSDLIKIDYNKEIKVIDNIFGKYS